MKKSPPHKALNKDNIVADIKLTLTHPKYKERILVIVEGIYDEKLYLKFFDNNDTGIKSTTGHRYYEHILEQLNDSYSSRFIILKDADFDHLNKKCYNKYPNLFLTDTHDIETMMINDAVVDSICSHYLDVDLVSNSAQ